MKNVVIAALMILVLGCGNSSEEAPAAQTKAQDFTLQNMNDETVSLSQYRGKTVLLVFWATWCPHCKAEIPRLKEIHKSYKDKDFSVLALSVDKNVEKLKEFVSENGIFYDVLFDKGAETARSYGAVGIPAHYVVDSEGNGYFFGPDIDSAMEKADALLNE